MRKLFIGPVCSSVALPKTFAVDVLGNRHTSMTVTVDRSRLDFPPICVFTPDSVLRVMH